MSLENVAGNLTLENVDRLTGQAVTVLHDLKQVFIDKEHMNISNRTRVNAWRHELEGQVIRSRNLPNTIMPWVRIICW